MNNRAKQAVVVLSFFLCNTVYSWEVTVENQTREKISCQAIDYDKYCHLSENCRADDFGHQEVQCTDEIIQFEACHKCSYQTNGAYYVESGQSAKFEINCNHENNEKNFIKLTCGATSGTDIATWAFVNSGKTKLSGKSVVTISYASQNGNIMMNEGSRVLGESVTVENMLGDSDSLLGDSDDEDFKFLNNSGSY
jgi:hypothetical protein